MKLKIRATLAAVALLALIVSAFIEMAGSVSAQPTTPGLPTPPPSLPTQVTNGDGSRLNCTPNYRYCWPAN